MGCGREIVSADKHEDRVKHVMTRTDSWDFWDLEDRVSEWEAAPAREALPLQLISSFRQERLAG